MTTRLAKVSTRAPKKVIVTVHCPGCGTARRAVAVGTGVVDGRRREILRCTDKACELEWLPSRQHVLAAA